METITVLSLLCKYRAWVRKGEIQFLGKGTDNQKEVLDLLEQLIPAFETAQDREGGLSKNLDWHQTHVQGRDLWQKLVSASLNHIDTNSKGNSALFDYLDKATQFEELLYGLEEYYRDHTLHSLWVYFIGEHLMRDMLPRVHADLNWYVYNDFCSSAGYKRDLINQARKQEETICGKVNEKRDAVWCVMALCHDLGYSLAKLDKINDRVRDVLRFFDLREFERVGYSLNLEQQYLVSQALELMSMEVHIDPDERYRDTSIDIEERVKIRCYRDDSTYWRLCRAFEQKQHGVLSAYLLFKVLGIFAEASIRETSGEWGLDEDEAVRNVMLGDILFAVAQHEFDFAHVNQIGSLADILLIADELEEFSRYGRQLLTRNYSDTTANAGICVTPENPRQGDRVEIEIVYDFDEQRQLNDYFMFFWRKARRLCTAYSLDLEPGTDDRYCTINGLKMTVRYKGHEMYFELRKGAENRNRGYLPETKVQGEKYGEGQYDLSCMDDKILVHAQGGRIDLEEWCNRAASQYADGAVSPGGTTG